MLVNHVVTSDVFFHWLSFVVFLIFDLILLYLFTDFCEFAFCEIYEAACMVVDEVIFVVFEGNKSLLFCDLFCATVDVELLGDGFCLWVIDVGGIGASFHVGGCDAVPQEFVVLRLVKLVKV
mgnify:FL=1